MTPRITVIIPTVGRPSLKASQKSAADADEVITVPDATGDFGYTPRTTGMGLATGTHLAFLDDDDVYLPGAIETMRTHATDRPVVFRMNHPKWGLLWREPELKFGNVGTPMFLIPNKPDQLGKWKPMNRFLNQPGGDFVFLKGCADKMGQPLWRDEVVAQVG